MTVDANPNQAPGKWYITVQCIDCGMCPEIAPTIFRRDDEIGMTIVHNQPRNQEEESLACEAQERCPAETIMKRIE